MRALAIALAAALLAPLSACSLVPGSDLYVAAGRERAKAAGQDILQSGEWTICRAAPVGAVVDRYGASHESAERWRAFCHGSGEPNIASPR